MQMKKQTRRSAIVHRKQQQMRIFSKRQEKDDKKRFERKTVQTFAVTIQITNTNKQD